MSKDNGKLKPEEEQKDLPAIEMRIVVEPGKPCVVHFPILWDKTITYGFLKVAEKALDAHYAKIEEESKSKIIQPKGGIMDFVKGGKRFK